MIRFISNSIILLILFFSVPDSCWAGPQKVSALLVEGDVQYQMPGSATSKKLTKGTALPEGTRITTGSASGCLLGFEGEKRGSIKLRQDSSLVLKALSEPAELDLDSGELFTKLRKLKTGSHFEVKTPTAVATVRGTGWLQSAVRLDVFEGSVHVKGSSGEEIDLLAGQSLPVDPSGDLGEAGPLSDESKKEWNDFSTGAEQTTTWEQQPFDDLGQGSAEQALDTKSEQQELQKEDDLLKAKDDSHDDHGGGNGFTGGQ